MTLKDNVKQEAWLFERRFDQILKKRNGSRQNFCGVDELSLENEQAV